MKAISKKLLSLLVVIAMVLSMVPFGGLSIFAVETKAAETETTNPGAAGNAIDNSDAAIEAHIKAGSCPMCGAEAGTVQWARATTGVWGMNNLVGGTKHAYFDSVQTTTSNLVQIVDSPATDDAYSKNTTVCVALKSTADITCAKYRIQISGTDDTNVLNIMGTGSIHAHQLESNGATDDLGLFQVDQGTVNLYGGKFTHTSWNKNFQTGAVIRVGSAKSTVNIYKGAVIGPDTQDTTNVAQNIQYAGAGKVNMYGGTIQNGVSPDYGYSGNVNIAAGGTFNMYDGLIKNGSFLDAAVGNSYGSATLGGNVFVGGNKNTKRTSDKDYTMSTGYFYMYGGEITNGKANNGGNGGGNIYYKAGGMSLEGGTISLGYAKAVGGNIQINGNGATIKGDVVISDGTALVNGGNIYMSGAYTLNIEGGQITGGTAKNGGNIYVANGTVKMTGGSVTGGTAAATGGHGGALYLTGTAATETAAAKIGKLDISGDAVLSGGSANYGDTIRMQPYSALAMNGGTIDGQIQPTDGACTAQTATITVSGEAKITGHGLDCGADGIILTDAGLTGTASIAVYQSGRPFVPYADEAAATAAKGFYKASQTGYGVVVNTDGTLEIGEIEAEYDPDIFQPWEFDDAKAYCPVCKQDVTGWKERTASTGQDSQGHWYLADDVTTDKDQTIYVNSSGTKMGCLNLNGHTLTMTGRIGMTIAGTTLNIMDTSAKKDGVITSSSSRSDSAYNDGTIVIQQSATVNLYGGTFRNSNSSADVVHMKDSADAKLNIYQGAVIDGGARYGVNVVKGAATLDGGTIQGASGNTAVVKVASGTTFTMDSGTIDGQGLVRSVETSGTFTMNGGTIQNGIAANGGNVLVNSGSTFTMNSGTIKDGKATNTETVSYVVAGGGNIYSLGNVTLNGGTVQDGKACGTGGNIHCAGGTLTIGDGTATTTEITVSGGKTGVTIGTATLANGYGGNIGVTAGTATVKAGALITDGSTNSESAKGGYGGNIYTYGGAKVYMQGGTVTKGTSGRGGNFDMNNGTVEISGGEVSNGISTSGGAGNVYVQNKGTLKIYGNAHLIGGQATNGGSIRHSGTAAQLVISGGIIEGGQATNGGNIYSEAANGVKISGNAEIKLGNAQKNGGNINITSASSLTIEGGEIHHGTAAEESIECGGGNIWSAGKVTMTGGEIHTGTAEVGPGGNVIINAADMEMSGDAKIYGGTATAHQGGNVRVYKGKLTMSGEAGIYGGHSGSSSKTHNVWIVAGDMEMDGNSYVYGKDQTNANAISLAPNNGTNCTLTLKGNAKVMNDPTDPVVSKGSINLSYTANNDTDLTNDMHANIVIDDSWTGEAYVMMFKSTGSLNTAGTATQMGRFNIGDTVDGGEGSVNGPVGTGTSFTGNLYYTARTYYTGIIGSAENKLVLAGHAVVDTANDTEQWMSMEEAVAAAAGSDTMYLLAADDVALNGETVYIDALKDINVDGEGTAYGIDIANGEDYANASTGKFSGNVESDATFNEVRYIKIADGTVHAIEMGIKSISLRTGACGLYYKAYYECDEALAKAITAYGVVLSTKDMPGTDWAPTDLFSLNENFVDPYDETTHKLDNVTSVSVFGIMKDDLEAAENKARGEMPIYANAYILVNNAEIFVGDTANKDKKVTDGDWDDAGVALSLRDVMDMVNTNWNSLTTQSENLEQIQKRVKEFYTEWYDLGMSEWEFSNITKIVTA